MASPASPRLPSPPPIPEDQLSPIAASPEQQKLFSSLDHNAARRIRPGTKAEDMAEGPPLVDLSEVRLLQETFSRGADLWIDRLSFPAHRTPESATQLPHTSHRLEWHNRRGQRYGDEACPAARERGQDALAVRAMSLPHPESQLDHRRAIFR